MFTILQLFFFVTQNVGVVVGYASVYLSANLQANIEITSPGWAKIKTWQIVAGTGHGKNGFAEANFQNGDFEIPLTGIYGVYVTLTLSVRDSETYKASVWMNNQENRQIPELSSSFKSSDGFRSLTIFGKVELLEGSKISVYTHSDTIKQWDVLGASDSTLGIEYLGLRGYVPGFSAMLMKETSIVEKTWRKLGGWKTSYSIGLFKSQTGFGEGSGSFYAICDGVYQFSANVFFNTTDPGRYEVALIHDGSTYGNHLFIDEITSNSSFTLSLAVTLSMKKGEYVALTTKGNKKYLILSETSFSGIMIAPSYQRIGFSTVFSESILGNGAFWIKISIPKPSNEYGQFNDYVESITDGSYSQSYTNILLLNGIFLIKSKTIESVGISIVTDTSTISGSEKYGIFQTKSKTSTSETSAYCLAGLIELSANQPLSIYVYLKISESFEILSGSRFSAISARHSYPAFNVIYENQVQYSSRDVWLNLDKWVVKKGGSFSLVGDIGASYQTKVSGLFLVSGNIIFHDANGPISALISINGDTSKRNSIYATNGHPSADKETLTMSGVIYVKQGSRISMKVKTEEDLSWNIAADSSFSCIFLGNAQLIPAVSTVLVNKLSIFTEGWRKLTVWTPQSMSEGFFESGNSFNYQDGDFVIPQEGLYVVSANIKFQLASKKDAEFKLNIAVNGDSSKYRSQNGLQDYLKISKSTEPFSDDYYSMISSGTVKCSKGDIISVYVYSKGDSSYEISQDSSMSVAFISPLKNHYTGGMQVVLAQGISQKNTATFSWKKVKHWSSESHTSAPGVFLEANQLFQFESSDGIFNVLETGLYYITVNVGIQDGNNDFEIALHTSISDVSSLHTAYGKTSPSSLTETRSSYSMKAFGVLFLEKEQRISVEIKSDDATQDWENLQDVTGWSILRIPPYSSYQQIMFGTKENQNLPSSPGLWSRITSWEYINNPYERSSKSAIVSGIFTVKESGLYVISATIVINGDFGSSNFIKIKIGANGDASSPGFQIFNSGKGPVCFVGACKTTCTQTCSHIMLVDVSDKIGVYVQSSLSQIPVHSTSSILIQYLQSKIPQPTGFSMKLENTQSINTNGKTPLTKWVSDENNRLTFLNPSGGTIATYKLPKSGYYLAILSVELSNLNGAVDLIIAVDNSNIISSSYVNNDDRGFSMITHGVFSAKAGDGYLTSVVSATDSSYTVAESSFNSLLYISDVVSGFAAQYEDDVSIDMKANIPIIMNRWASRKDGGQFLFDLTNNLKEKQTFLVQKTGVYLAGGHVIIENRYANAVSTSVYIVVNGKHSYESIVQATSLLHNQKWKTLEFFEEVFLERWDTLEIALKTDKEITLSVKKQSSFFAILNDDLTHQIGCEDAGPNVVSFLTPTDLRVKFGEDLQWTCKATGNNIQFAWEKDGKLLAEESSNTLQLNGMKREDSGDYTCIAKADGIEDSSNAASLYVFDPSPYFLNDIDDFTVNVKENGEQSQAILVIKARAESFESGDSEMAFKLLGDTSDIFTINPYLSKTGTTLIRTKQLDRETQNIYHLQIWANTPSTPDSERSQNITIIVTDINDNAPVFEQQSYNTSVKENISPGTEIITITAIDPDENNVATYQLIPGTSPVFKINEQTGSLTAANPIDKQPGTDYIFYVIATDGEKYSYAKVIVYVEDVNNNAPYFLATNYVGAFSAALSPNNKIIKVSAIDKDYGENARIVYTITSGNDDEQFVILDDGTIELTRHLSDTKIESFHLQISIRDSGNPPLLGTNKANVTLGVRTASDNRPIFSRVDYKMVIEENSLDASLQVSAVDATGDTDNRITYSIPSTYNVSHSFKISPDGLITLVAPLDYEKEKLYVFAVEARDSGLPPKVATAYVTATVLDVNDNKPIFTNTSATITIKESTDVSKALYEVSANDKDSPEFGSVSYKFLSGNIGNIFFINPIEGFVRANERLDYETRTSYTLSIGAFDSGKPSLRSTEPFTLKINIEDVNDNAPKFNKETYDLVITENTGGGESLTKFSVTDKDSGINKDFNVELVGVFARSNFEIVATDQNGVYDLKLKETVDYEELINFDFYIKARDKGEPGLESQAKVQIKVNDVNDNPPRFQNNVSVVITDDLKDNLFIYRAVATDSDRGPGDKLRYYITEGNADGTFKIEQFTGEIRVNDTSKFSYGKQYQLIIRAEDSFSPPMVSQPFVLTITTAVALKLENTRPFQYQFKVMLKLDEFSHLRNIDKIQILVQMYKPSFDSFFFITQQEPLSYYKVFFGDNENRVRRYVALDIPLPITRRIQRRDAEQVPQEIEVTIGEDTECDKKQSQHLLICNGPLIPGEEYRLQVHVFQVGNPIPFESYFSNTIMLKAASSGASSSAQISTASEDGMLAMAATFGLVYITVVLVILIFVFWKQRHELLHIDHLRERRDIIDDSHFFSGKEFYSTSDLGSVTKKYPQFDDDSLIWPDLNNSGSSTGGNILHPIKENDDIHHAEMLGNPGSSNNGFVPDEFQSIPIENLREEIPAESSSFIEERFDNTPAVNEMNGEKDNDAESSNEPVDEITVFTDRPEESDENHETASNEPIYESADRIRDAINLRNDQGRGKIRKTYADSKFEVNLYSDSSDYSMRKGLIDTSKDDRKTTEDEDDGQAILL